MFARFISVLSIDGGVLVGHQADTKLLVPSMGSFKPTFLLAVPRVFEKVYNSSEQKAESGGKGKIFRRAVDVAIAHSKALDAGHVPLGLKLQFALFDRLVLSKIKAALGGRVRYAVSGSAPLGLRLGHFYRSLDVKILEGYGLTETTAPISVNLPSKFKIGYVGPPLPGVSVRIAEDGEIQAKGVDVFKGYWNNDEATKDTFTSDGWFKTGDIGTLDEDGYLQITGRIKETHRDRRRQEGRAGRARGPDPREPDRRPGHRRRRGQAVHRGARHPRRGDAADLAQEQRPGRRACSVADAAKNPVVLAEIQKAVDAANSKVSRAESIRKFVVLDADLTEATGHLTPKLSIKRSVIVKDFADQIEAMYVAAPETQGASLQ